jgi:hypothetical protein
MDKVKKAINSLNNILNIFDRYVFAATGLGETVKMAEVNVPFLPIGCKMR